MPRTVTLVIRKKDDSLAMVEVHNVPDSVTDNDVCDESLMQAMEEEGSSLITVI